VGPPGRNLTVRRRAGEADRRSGSVTRERRNSHRVERRHHSGPVLPAETSSASKLSTRTLAIPADVGRKVAAELRKEAERKK
jgi:hypothetical protein